MRIFALFAVCAVFCMSCATKKYVSGEIQRSEVKTQGQIEELKAMIESTQTEIRNLADEFQVKLDPLEKATQENAEFIQRMGELRFQTTLADNKAYFKSESAELTDAAREELDKFGKMLHAQNRLVNLEIQGHTDSRGSELFNLKLGEDRSLAVRNYLYENYDIPLHLMSVISFGSKKPISDNDTKEGRALNRRVVLVVRVKL
ncbi:MAG: OmpA family protein [Acidobacteria bacterium]|nr:OmpA family protein [Acidobacteriota bacterium]